jgi:hypothetical protein
VASFLLIQVIGFPGTGTFSGNSCGTSLIDAHAGGVGLMESVPQLDSEAKGYYGLSKDFLIIMI